MEAMSEHERYEQGVLPRDLEVNTAIQALQLLIEAQQQDET